MLIYNITIYTQLYKILNREHGTISSNRLKRQLKNLETINHLLIK